MADPRFYDNFGPVSVAELCAKAKLPVPAGVNPAHAFYDVAGLEDAGSAHLAYCSDKSMVKGLPASRAGFLLVDDSLSESAPASAIVLSCSSPVDVFVSGAEMLYPSHEISDWQADSAIDPSARLGDGIKLCPGVVIGPDAEIGDETRIGPNTVIGRGVAIGRNCEISANVTITHSYIGDHVVILPGAQIGQPGFGFVSGRSGHKKIPQIGRVIIQDRVEIGAGTTIDRGALGDTVVGEGSKVDNLVQIGHNCRIGRHCVIVAQTGISGSCSIGQFVVLGGQAGVADHATIGDGARLAARAAAAPGELPGGKDYGGVPARPMQQWRRELAAVALLARRPRSRTNG